MEKEEAAGEEMHDFAGEVLVREEVDDHATVEVDGLLVAEGTEPLAHLGAVHDEVDDVAVLVEGQAIDLVLIVCHAEVAVPDRHQGVGDNVDLLEGKSHFLAKLVVRVGVHHPVDEISGAFFGAAEAGAGPFVVGVVVGAVSVCRARWLVAVVAVGIGPVVVVVVVAPGTVPAGKGVVIRGNPVERVGTGAVDGGVGCSQRTRHDKGCGRVSGESNGRNWSDRPGLGGIVGGKSGVVGELGYFPPSGRVVVVAEDPLLEFLGDEVVEEVGLVEGDLGVDPVFEFFDAAVVGVAETVGLDRALDGLYFEVSGTEDGLVEEADNFTFEGVAREEGVGRRSWVDGRVDGASGDVEECPELARTVVHGVPVEVHFVSRFWLKKLSMIWQALKPTLPSIGWG